MRPPLLGRDDDTVVGQRVPAWVGQLELPRVLAVDQLEDRHRGAVSEEAGGGAILSADIGPSDEVLAVLVGEDQRHRGRVADFPIEAGTVFIGARCAQLRVEHQLRRGGRPRSHAYSRCSP